VDKLATKVGSGVTPKGGSSVYQKSGVKLIRSQNVHFSGLSLDDVAYISPEIHESMSGSKVLEGDVLLNITGASIGRCTYVPDGFGEANVNQHVCIIRPKRDILSRYLAQWLSSDFGQHSISIFQAGGNREGLNFQQIRGIPVSLPPLPEQQKIAAILSTVDDVIEKTRAQIDKLKDLKTGMMQELLTKGIGHTEFKDSPVGRIPVGWDVKPLTEISTFRRGSFPQPYGLPEWYSDSGYPFVQVYDIASNGRLKPSTKVRITDAAASKSVFVARGSVAVSIQGSIGRVAITQYDAYFDRTILIFTKLNSNIDKEYFALMIGEIFRVKKDSADGGVIKTITKETLKDFLLKLPPIEEQKEISQALGEVDSNIRLKSEKAARLVEVKKALMQDLLTGKVRVNIDNKESAVA
jgi:type I restriction enzyme S subunit